MKNLWIIAILAIFSFTSMNAQGVTFGAKAGVNFASITGDGTDNLDMRTSLHVGGVAEIAFSDKFSLQPELLYSSQGAKASFSGFEAKTKLDYLNLPVMAKYYVAEGFSVEAGPQVGVLLSAKVDTDNSIDLISSSPKVEVDIKDETSDIDFGLKFGAGYKLESGLNFGAHYNLGLADLNDNTVSDSGDFKNQNGVIQVSVGYFF